MPTCVALQLQRFNLIAEITEKINRGRSFDEVFRSVHQALQGLIPCHRLSAGLLADDGRTLSLRHVLSDGKILLPVGYSESIEGSSLKALIETGAPRVINRLGDYLQGKPGSRSTRLIVKEGMQASLTVPLVVADRRIGVLWCSSRERDAYTPDHESFVRVIAGHLAILLEKDTLVGRLEADNRALADANELKARFVERLKEEVGAQTAALSRADHKTRIMLDIAKAIHRTRDLGEVFRTLVASLRPIVGFARASILMLAEGERVLAFRELEPPEREFLGRDAVIPVEGSAAGEAIRTGRPLCTGDLAAGTRWFEDDPLRRAGIRSRVAIPLFDRRRPIGTFNLASDQPDRYAAEEVDFLVQLAEQISVAVANSEAYREIERLKNRFQDETIRLREVISRSPGLASDLIGDSPAWRKVLRELELVAGTDATVLLRGETGTGKEVLARAIHRLSPRRGRPFIAINCGALSPELVASELFGHEKGAFTGAIQRKLGRLELANHGVLFLDEVAELSSDLQVKFLRVLQEREFERVGGTATIKVDVRVIAATNRDLEAARAERRFRDDLFFRLNVFPIVVPPLRERKEDIEALVLHFLRRLGQKVNKRFERIDKRTLERCIAYHWPGNVRELENLVERSVILSKPPVFAMDPLLEVEALSAREGGGDGGEGPLAPLRDVVRAHLTEAVRLARGKIYGKGGAAELLGLKPSTLQAKLKSYGIDRRG